MSFKLISNQYFFIKDTLFQGKVKVNPIGVSPSENTLRCDISKLRNEPLIVNNFSNKLDEILVNDPILNDLNVFDNFLTESIIQASESEVPKVVELVQKSPWADEFLSLVKARRVCQNPSERKELGRAKRRKVIS